MKLKFKKLNEDWLDDLEDSSLDAEIENNRLFTNPEQEFSSKDTSIRQVPALHKDMAKRKMWKEKSVNLDYGGGRYDDASDFVHALDLGVKNLVYDAFNRDEKHNRRVENFLIHNGGADSVTCANVLNVIKEPSVRNSVIENIYYFLKDGCTAYFTVYDSGQEKETSKGYQLGKKLSFYVPEVASVFGDENVTTKYGMIIARK